MRMLDPAMETDQQKQSEPERTGENCRGEQKSNRDNQRQAEAQEAASQCALASRKITGDEPGNGSSLSR